MKINNISNSKLNQIFKKLNLNLVKPSNPLLLEISLSLSTVFMSNQNTINSINSNSVEFLFFFLSALHTFFKETLLFSW
jgi:hypothetical protein